MNGAAWLQIITSTVQGVGDLNAHFHQVLAKEWGTDAGRSGGLDRRFHQVLMKEWGT